MLFQSQLYKHCQLFEMMRPGQCFIVETYNIDIGKLPEAPNQSLAKSLASVKTLSHSGEMVSWQLNQLYRTKTV